MIERLTTRSCRVLGFVRKRLPGTAAALEALGTGDQTTLTEGLRELEAWWPACCGKTQMSLN
jgi:hypothetical protein